MRAIRVALVRLAAVLRGTAHDRDFEQELQSHLDMEIEANIRAGMSPHEARRLAVLRFDGLESIKETYRDRRGIPLLDTALRDARYALRTLRKNRGATLIGILVMALGIGANTAVFSVVHAVLLNPLPYPNPDRIVTLTYESMTANSTGDRRRQVSVPDFLDWQRDSTTFDAMTYYTTGRGSVMAGSVAEYAVVTRVSDEFFRVIGVPPMTGRMLSRDDRPSDGTGAALVSDRFAREHFGEPAQALGRPLRLANQSAPIVGVLPSASSLPAETDIWLLINPATGNSPQERRGNNFLALARLRDGQGLDQARSEMTAISARLERQYPDTNKNMRVRVTPLQREMVGDVEAMLYLLVGAVALVLLIACATMATLLLAQATSRVPEIAVRGALGASRGRLLQQLLVEAAVQSFAAGAIGVMIAMLGTRALVALAPTSVPRLDEVGVSGSVLLFAVALCALVSVLFGLPPALQAIRVDVNDRLRRGAARTAGDGGGRMREALVVVEIALAVILVAAGTLLVRSLIALQQTPLGFQPGSILLMQASAAPRGSDWGPSRTFFKGLLDDIRQVPGVAAAGAMMGPPGRVDSESGYWVDRMPAQAALNSARPAVMNVVSPGAFDALGVPIRNGRDFDDRDSTGAPLVVIVNAALAKAAFAGRDPVGRQIVAGFDLLEPMTIVGVVDDVRQYGPGREPQPEVYMPYQQHFYNGATLQVIVRTAIDPAALAPVIQRKARERSPEVSVRVSTMEALLAEHVATAKFRTWLLSLFGGVAMCLALAGVYGVMAYVAGQRSKEIGVRMALGATSRHVLWLMVSRALTLTGIGLAAGVLGAIGSTRLISGMLYQVKPHDIATYAGVVTALGLLSLLATYLPARRATQIDPLTVLRQD